MNGVILRILSGTHLGAEIELSPGTWVVGRDDSCDIILTEVSIAPRHVAFRVTESDVLEFECLDGTLLGVDGNAPAESMLVAGEIYRMGAVFFAWGLSDATEDFWKEVENTLSTLSTSRAQAVREAAASEGERVSAQEGEPDTEATERDEKSGNESEPEGAEKKEDEAVTDKSRSAGTILGMLVVVAIAGALFSQHYSRDAEKTETAEDNWLVVQENARPSETPSLWEQIWALLGFPTEKSTDERLRDIQGRLSAEGFMNVVGAYANGQWQLTGSVKNDEERGRLVRFARTLSGNALINVSVDSDYTVALESAFNTKGYWPTVTLRKNVSDGANALEVSAYMLSSVIEERAFEEALATVPGVSSGIEGKQFTLKRVIRHRDYLEPLFAKLFTAAGLRDVNVEYGPGEVRLLTVLTPDRRKALEGVLAKVKAESVVPVKINVVNVTNAAAVAKATKTEKATTPVDPMKPRFRVTGVSGGALKFVTLSTGEKVFVGGTLPGGFVLESITLDRLDLSKNGKRIKYPLRIGK